MRNILNKNVASTLLLVVTILLLVACTGRDTHFDEHLNYDGPYVLNSHIIFIDQEKGELIAISPRDAEEPYKRLLLNPEAEEEWTFRHVLTFPDKTRMLVVSEDEAAYYVIRDSDFTVEQVITDLELDFNRFAFSPDGKWMIGYRFGENSYNQPGYYEDDYYYDDNYYYDYDSDTMRYYGSEVADGNYEASAYELRGNRAIIANTHTLLILNRETGEVAMPSLGKNDVPIASIQFTGEFRLCKSSTTCSAGGATEFYRAVAFGDSRLWIFDPEDGEQMRADVIPLSTETENSLAVRFIRSSANMADDMLKADGVDGTETLFIAVENSVDIVAVNMLWDENKDDLTYSINKLGMPFVVRDFIPYASGGELHLLAIDGRYSVADVHAGSARLTQLSLPMQATTMQRYTTAEDEEAAILSGGSGMMLVRTANFDLLAEKNINKIDFGFSPEDVYITKPAGTENALAIAMRESTRKLVVVDLERLAEENLSADVLEMATEFDDTLLDLRNATLYLLGYDGEEPETRTVYALPLIPGGVQRQFDIEDVDGPIRMMRGGEDQSDLLVFAHRSQPDTLTTISTDGEWAETFAGYLFGEELF